MTTPKHLHAISLLLCILLVLSLAACATSEPVTTAQPQTPAPTASPESSVQPSDSGTDAADSGAVVYPLVAEGTATLTWLYDMQAPATTLFKNLQEDNMVWKEVRKRTGVNIEFDIVTPATQGERFNLVIASGDYPDLNKLAYLYTGGGDKAIEDGIYLRCNDLVEKYMPDYYKELVDRDLMREAITDSGNMYGIGQINATVQLQFVGLTINQTWLDELGLSVPSTYDETYNVLTRFKNDKGAVGPMALDPCGFNSYLTTGMGVNSGLRIAQFYNNNNGVAECGLTNPNFRTYVEMMKKWYEEGLIDPDFVSRDSAGYIPNPDAARLDSGDNAFFPCYYQCVLGYYHDTGIVTKDWSYSPVQNLTQQKGTRNSIGMNINNFPAAGICAIHTTCEDPILAARFLNFFYTKEGELLANYGFEGVTFEYNDKGDPELMDWLMFPDTGVTSWCMWVGNLIGNGPLLYHWSRSSAEDDKLAVCDAAWAGDLPNGQYSSAMPGNMTYTPDESAEMSRIGNDILTYVQEQIPRFIMGVNPMSDWDSFVAKLKTMELDKVTQIINASLTRFNNR